MGRHASDLRIALNACMLAVASCYAGNAQALARPVTLSPAPPASIPDALGGAAASIPVEHRWSVPPGLAPALPYEIVAPDSLLDERTPLRTNTGGRLQTVGPQSMDPVLKVAPDGNVLLDAGASVRYADTHRPGVRIELSAPRNAGVSVGRMEGAGAVINPYAALVRSAARPNANEVVVENGRVFLRRAETRMLARSEDTPVEIAHKSVPDLSMAYAAPLSARHDVPALDSPVTQAIVETKTGSWIVDPFFSGEDWIAVTEHEAGRGVTGIKLFDETAAEITHGIPGDDVPLLSRRPQALLAPARRDSSRLGGAQQDVLPEPADLFSVSEAGLPRAVETTARVQATAIEAPRSGTAVIQARVLRVNARNMAAADSAVRGALVILPIVERTIPEQVARARMVRLVIDLFDDPEEIEAEANDARVDAAPARPDARPDARVMETRGAIALRARPAAIARKNFLLARTRRD